MKKRERKKIMWNGELRKMAEVAKEHGLTMNCVRGRLNMGWTPERSVSEPLKPKRIVLLNVPTKKTTEIADVSYHTVRRRLRLGREPFGSELYRAGKNSRRNAILEVRNMRYRRAFNSHFEWQRQVDKAVRKVIEMRISRCSK